MVWQNLEIYLFPLAFQPNGVQVFKVFPYQCLLSQSHLHFSSIEFAGEFKPLHYNQAVPSALESRPTVSIQEETVWCPQRESYWKIY